MMYSNVAIIGGGPAGLYAAWLLSSNGTKCTVFDHRIPWEKPCGGGITSKAFERFAMLNDWKDEMQTLQEFTFVSPTDNVAYISGNASLNIISRARLSELMLAKCLQAGMTLLPEKITAIRKEENGYTLIAETEHHGFDFVIGADGAHGTSRNLFGATPFNKNRFAAMGYFIDGLSEKEVIIKYYKDFQGYLWMFPRPDHASVGIGFKSGTCTKKEALLKVREFMKEHYPGYAVDETKSYAATIPYATDWVPSNFQGEGWALVGDAAGFTDAITGEGIYYAFRSGEILAECLLKGKAEGYYDATQPIRREIAKAHSIAPRLYTNAILEKIVSNCRRSAFAREIMADAILGHLAYLDIKKAVFENKWKILRQIIWGTLFPQKKRRKAVSQKAA